MGTISRSAKYQLIDHLLPNGLAYLVNEGRAAKHSWRRIVLEIRDQTGVEVTEVTLRAWWAVNGRG